MLAATAVYWYRKSRHASIKSSSLSCSQRVMFSSVSAGTLLSLLVLASFIEMRPRARSPPRIIPRSVDLSCSRSTW
ncbi:hypothetical protein HYQ46_003569 [Verticillium longisporum]|nr:hypothetical protein HYQ46_003569 [Verticillium longisporum]